MNQYSVSRDVLQYHHMTPCQYAARMTKRMVKDNKSVITVILCGRNDYRVANTPLVMIQLNSYQLNKIFAPWAFCKKLTCGENMEVWKKLVHSWLPRFIVKSGRRTCQFQPEQSDYTARMGHVSHQMQYRWLLPLLDQLPGVILRATTHLLDQDDCFCVVTILTKPSS